MMLLTSNLFLCHQLLKYNTDRNYITVILLKVPLNTITLTPSILLTYLRYKYVNVQAIFT